MTQYAGDQNVFPTTYTIVSDNTARNASSINVSLEALGDRTAWLKYHSVNGIDGGTYSGPLTFTNIQGISGPGNITVGGDISCNDLTASGGVGVTGAIVAGGSVTSFTSMFSPTYNYPLIRTFVRVQNSGFFYADPNQWGADGTSAGLWVSSTAGTRCFSLLDLPHNCTLVNLSVYVASANLANLPANAADRIKWNLKRTSKTGGGTTETIGSSNATDTSINTTAYRIMHPITQSSLFHLYDKENYRYHIEVTGDAITVGTKVYMVEAVFERGFNGEE